MIPLGDALVVLTNGGSRIHAAVRRVADVAIWMFAESIDLLAGSRQLADK
jgi:hypothetical protein